MVYVIILCIAIVLVFVVCENYTGVTRNVEMLGGYRVFDTTRLNKCNMDISKIEMEKYIATCSEIGPGFYFSNIDNLALMMLDRDQDVKYYISLILEDHCKNFAGVYQSDDSDTFIVFFHPIKDAIPVDVDELYPLVVKYNREVYETNKNIIAASGHHDDDLYVGLVENMDGKYDAVPEYVDARESLPAPTCGFFDNRRSTESFFNSALEFLLRIDDVSLSEHPDLYWLRHARKEYKNINRKEPDRLEAYEFKWVNTRFTVNNVTKFKYIEKTMTTLPLPIKYLARDGISGRDVKLEIPSDPCIIIESVLQIASHEYSFIQAQVETIDECNNCNKEDVKPIPQPSIMELHLPAQSSSEYDVEDLFKNVNTDLYIPYANKLCRSCAITSQFAITEKIENLTKLRYILAKIEQPVGFVKLRNIQNLEIEGHKFDVVAIICRERSGEFSAFIHKNNIWYHLQNEKCTITLNIHNFLDNTDIICFALERE